MHSVFLTTHQIVELSIEFFFLSSHFGFQSNDGPPSLSSASLQTSYGVSVNG